MRPGRFLAALILLLICVVLTPSTIEIVRGILTSLQESFFSETLALPAWIDYAAVFVFGTSGAMVARQKGYDYVGAFVLAGITAMGGALVRDGICIQDGISPIFEDGNYMVALICAWLCGIFLGGVLNKFDGIVMFCDALGLGLYAVFGTNKSLVYGMTIPVAVGIGFINAVGGGLLRDVIAREEPMVFKPGQFYGVVAVVGSALYVMLHQLIPPTIAAIVVAVVTLVLRYAAVRLNLHSQPISDTQDWLRGYIHELRHKKKETLPPDIFANLDDVDDFEKHEKARTEKKTKSRSRDKNS
ncbi:MAG: TRIC cation channel family protein [Opitutales bacterium]|nr:TRIC cation channel family protein [Opitutales bacterium]